MSAKKRAKPVKPAKNTKVAKKTAKAAKKSAPKAKAKKSVAAKVAPKKGKPAAKAAKKAAPKAKAKGKGQAKKKTSATPIAVKKGTPKKAGAKKSVIKQKVTRGKADPTIVSHRDATGHLDPKYAAELHELSIESEEPTTERAFISGTSSGVAIAEELAEEFVAAVTSGEDDQLETRNEDTEEDAGGPFVASTAGTEFAEGTDESNPESATKEPFPKT